MITFYRYFVKWSPSIVLEDPRQLPCLPILKASPVFSKFIWLNLTSPKFKPLGVSTINN